MNANIVSALMLVAVSAAPMLAQQPVLSDRVAKSMPVHYLAPTCGLKPNHFKVSSGAAYLKSSIESDVPESRARILNDGERVLLEAMKQNGQEKNPAAWYFLGRIYLQRGDIYGADSTLTRAVALAPNCAKDVDGYRKNAWVALVKGGSQFEDQKNADSALAHLSTDRLRGTALYDAITTAAQQLKSNPLPGRVIIVLTDGADNASNRSIQQAIAAARDANAAVYTIGVEGSGFTPDPLLQISEATGGQYYGASSTSGLASVYGTIAQTLFRRPWGGNRLG